LDCARQIQTLFRQNWTEWIDSIAQDILDKEQPTVEKISVLDDKKPVPLKVKGTDGKNPN